MLLVDGADECGDLRGIEVVDSDGDPFATRGGDQLGGLLDRLRPVDLRALRARAATGHVDRRARFPERGRDSAPRAARSARDRAIMPPPGHGRERVEADFEDVAGEPWTTRLRGHGVGRDDRAHLPRARRLRPRDPPPHRRRHGQPRARCPRPRGRPRPAPRLPAAHAGIALRPTPGCPHDPRRHPRHGWRETVDPGSVSTPFAPQHPHRLPEVEFQSSDRVAPCAVVAAARARLGRLRALPATTPRWSRRWTRWGPSWRRCCASRRSTRSTSGSRRAPEDFDTLVAKTAAAVKDDLRLDGGGQGAAGRADHARVRRRGLDPPRPHRRVLRAPRRRAARRELGRLAAAGRPARDPARPHALRRLGLPRAACPRSCRSFSPACRSRGRGSAARCG